jgi:hypothetical protein
MPDELVTVFRSADSTAKDDAEAIRDVLGAAGIEAQVIETDSEDIVGDTFKVCVPADKRAEAEQIVNSRMSDAETAGVSAEVDTSDALDLQAVFSGEGTTAEMEALGIKSILDASGIDAVLVGTSTLPNLRFEVRVPREKADDAREVILEAQQAGPAAADAAERESEASGVQPPPD